MKVEDGEKVEGERRASDNGVLETPPEPQEEGEGEGEVVENGGGEGEFYDRSKSFFDNISCELSAAGSNR